MDDDGVQTAFDLILEEIGSVSKELKDEAKRLVDKDDFDAVSNLMSTGKRLDSFQLKVKALQKEWIEAFDLGTRIRTHFEPTIIETHRSQALHLTMKYAEAFAEAECIGRQVTVLQGSSVRKQTFASIHENVFSRRTEALKKGELIPCDNPELLELKVPITFGRRSVCCRLFSQRAERVAN